MRRFFLAAALTTFVVMPAAANEFCNQELTPLGEKRAELQAQLERISKNPNARGARERFCRTIGAFIGNLQQTQTYMRQNKEFCQIPDDVLSQVSQGIRNASRTRRQVCTAAARPRPQQRQQVVVGPDGQPVRVQPIPKQPDELRLK